MKENVQVAYIPKHLPCCGLCGAKNVRIYREYQRLRNKESDRCNECIDQKEKGWMVPCLLNEDGLAWGYCAIPDKDVDFFFSLPEKSKDFPTWIDGKSWSDYKY